MKMKKLLSIGALGLVMACSTSVASFAADTKSLSSDEKAIIVAMAKEYKNGGSILVLIKIQLLLVLLELIQMQLKMN